MVGKGGGREARVQALSSQPLGQAPGSEGPELAVETPSDPALQLTLPKQGRAQSLALPVQPSKLFV